MSGKKKSKKHGASRFVSLRRPVKPKQLRISGPYSVEKAQDPHAALAHSLGGEAVADIAHAKMTASPRGEKVSIPLSPRKKKKPATGERTRASSAGSSKEMGLLLPIGRNPFGVPVDTSPSPRAAPQVRRRGISPRVRTRHSPRDNVYRKSTGTTGNVRLSGGGIQAMRYQQELSRLVKAEELASGVNIAYTDFDVRYTSLWFGLTARSAMDSYTLICALLNYAGEFAKRSREMCLRAEASRADGMGAKSQFIANKTRFEQVTRRAAETSLRMAKISEAARALAMLAPTDQRPVFQAQVLSITAVQHELDEISNAVVTMRSSTVFRHGGAQPVEEQEEEEEVATEEKILDMLAEADVSNNPASLLRQPPAIERVREQLANGLKPKPPRRSTEVAKEAAFSFMLSPGNSTEEDSTSYSSEE